MPPLVESNLTNCTLATSDVKVIINSAPGPRKEYANLPERDPNDPIRQRLGEKRLSEEKLANEQSTAENLSVDDVSKRTGTPIPRDFIEDYLADGETEAAEETSEHRSWRHTRWAPLAFAAAVLALAGIWYVASHFDHSLPLERITVRGATLLSDREIMALAGISSKDRFYEIDLKAIQKKLLVHSLIKAAHPRREMNPATIVLDIEERQPIAMLRSVTTGEAFIIDRDGLLLRPKLIAGLRDPARLMQLPLLSGVAERDTIGYQAMAQLVAMISAMDSGSLRSAIGELRRTPTGAYVIYTPETQTPIFIGSPFDVRFQTAMEEQQARGIPPKTSEPLFIRQLHLLAKVWKRKLQTELRSSGALYVDARFDGQIILKHRQSSNMSASTATRTDTAMLSLMTSVMKNSSGQ